MVGAANLYLLMEVWQGGKIGVRRYAVINAQKSPIFVIFRPLDTENFGLGFQGLYGKRSTPGQGPMGSCSIIWDSRHPGDMHGRVLLHTRLPGIAKEGQTLLLLMVGKTCVLSLISNQVIKYLIIIIQYISFHQRTKHYLGCRSDTWRLQDTWLLAKIESRLRGGLPGQVLSVAAKHRLNLGWHPYRTLCLPYRTLCLPRCTSSLVLVLLLG